MSQNNPYEAPSANLSQDSSAHALNPNWQIGAVLSEGWALSNGLKAPVWGAFFFFLGIIILLGAAFYLVTLALPSDLIFLALGIPIVHQVFQLIFTAPFLAGILMIGIKHVRGQPVKAKMVFDYLPNTPKLFAAYLLVTLLCTVGFLLLVIPGIYLTLAYALALPLLVDKNLSIWDALETSRKGLTSCWFRFLGLGIICFLIVIVSAVPFGIGLIWTLPWLYATMGVVYRDVFGASAN